MGDIMKLLYDFNLTSVAVRLLLALLMGAAIGLERTKHGRSAGMRTHILVCIGGALASLIGVYAVLNDLSGEATRVGAQVISGIGFLGAGLILVQNRSRIIGLTTAAGLWNTAIIGLALGIGLYEGAVICFAVAMLTTLVLPYVESYFNKNDKHTMIYIELKGTEKVNACYDVLRNSGFGEIHKIDVAAPRSGNAECVGIYLTLTLPKKSDVYVLEKTLCEIDGVQYAVEI